MLNYEVKIESVEMFKRIEKALAGVLTEHLVMGTHNCMTFKYAYIQTLGVSVYLSGHKLPNQQGRLITDEDTFIRRVLEHFGKPCPAFDLHTHSVPADVVDRARVYGIVPGALVRWDNTPEFVVPPYSKWRDCGTGWAWYGGTGEPHEKCWLYSAKEPRYIPRVISPQDDEIRVGDMVDGVWERGVFHLWWRHYEVCRTDDKYVYLKDCFGDEHSYDRSIHTFKKIKTAGGLSSTTNNQHNGISGESEGKGNGQGKGQAVRTGSITGIVAVGGKPAGDPIQARTGKGRLGCTQISLTAVGSEHL